MGSFGIEAYGYVIQYRHSSDPLSSKYIHAHVLTLNIKQSDNKLIQNDYYFDLDKMRETWKNTINKFTDLDLKESDPVNIHSEYASVKFDKKKIIDLRKSNYIVTLKKLMPTTNSRKHLSFRNI